MRKDILDKVTCYDAERTICDIFCSEIVPQDKQVAVKEYLKENKDVPKLMEYVKIFKMDKKIKQIEEEILWYFWGTYLRVVLKNGLKELLMKNYPTLMKKKDNNG